MIGRPPPPAAPKSGPPCDRSCHSKVAGQDTACRVVERASSTLRRPKTQDKCQSLRDRGALVETAAVLAVLSAGDAVTRCPHRDGGELPDLPGAGPSARCTRWPTTSSGASGAGRPSRGWRPAAGPGRGGRGPRPRCLRVAGYSSLRPASPARSTMTSARPPEHPARASTALAALASELDSLGESSCRARSVTRSSASAAMRFAPSLPSIFIWAAHV